MSKNKIYTIIQSKYKFKQIKISIEIQEIMKQYELKRTINKTKQTTSKYPNPHNSLYQNLDDRSADKDRSKDSHNLLHKVKSQQIKYQHNHTKNESSQSYLSRPQKRTSITQLNTSIPVLEQQLRALKQEQKKYNMLANKLKQIQKQYKRMQQKQQSQQEVQEKQQEIDQIEQYKKQIQQCINETKRLNQQTKQLNKQIEQSHKQQSSLENMLTGLREANRLKRHQNKEKGIVYQQKVKQMETIQKQRDNCQMDIQNIKEQVEKLASQQYRFRKQAEIIEYQQLEEKKAIEKYQQLKEKLKIDCVQIQAKVKNVSAALLSQQQKYRNIREEINILAAQENQLIQQIRRRQNLSKDNKQKIIRGRAKIQGLHREIQCADQDLKLLTTQYSKQTDRLRQLQNKNNQLNGLLDQTSKDAKEIWESLNQTLGVAMNNQDIWSLDNFTKLRNQALEIWNQIQGILH